MRKKIRNWTEEKGVRNAWMGRQLRRLFLSEGLADVSVATRVMLRIPPVPEWQRKQATDIVNSAAEDGYLTTSEAEAYLRWMQEAIDDGTWLSASVMFIVAGTVLD